MILVTGGTGFIGSALVNALVKKGKKVRVLDNNSRGDVRRISMDVEYVLGDVRDIWDVSSAMRGVDEVCHLAFINGTENFYKRPDDVLDVGVRGIVNILRSCEKSGVASFLLVSSSEVYQTPPVIPTSEVVPLTIPDPFNPRYSYAAGKIISEIMAIHHAKNFERMLIARPHNIYGPDMGDEHVIPQLAKRAREDGVVAFRTSAPKVWGDKREFWGGDETRAFCYIDDCVDGLMAIRKHGLHMNIYNVGTEEEVSISDLACRIAAISGVGVKVITSDTGAAEGGTPRRCPDISKLRALGYSPKVPLDVGLPMALKWYMEHST